MNKEKLYLLFQLGGWSFYVVFQMIGVTVFTDSDDIMLKGYIPFILEGGVFLVITHLYRWLMKRRGWLQLNLAQLLPRILVSVVVLGALVYLLRIAFTIPFGILSDNSKEIIAIATNTLGNALILFLWFAFYFTYNYFERYNLALKHEAAMKEIELQNLKSQLNPHFIFNSLNSIRALVDEDPTKSKTAITYLSNILRGSLASDKRKLTLFSEELNLVKEYLSLEIIRYEERLSTSFDISSGTLQMNIPPLMLQTLVENAIKHGISQLKEGGIINIKSYIENTALIVEIRNSGNYEVFESRNTSIGGMGISNTKRRLEMIYGEKADFKIYNEQKGVVLTKLRLPQQLTYESINN